MLSIFKRNREQTNRQQTDAGVKRSRDGWFGRIRGLFSSPELDDAVWDELEEILISADVAVETTVSVIDDLRADVRAGRVADGEQALLRLKDLLAAELSDETNADAWFDDNAIVAPYVILMCGVNGVGKTTSIAKLAHHFTDAGKKVVLGAADTFRAAAEEQLEILGERLAWTSSATSMAPTPAPSPTMPGKPPGPGAPTFSSSIPPDACTPATT